MRPSGSTRLQSGDDEGQQQQVLVKRPVVAFTSSPSDGDPHQCLQAQPPVSASAQPKAECGADEMEPVGSPVDHSGTVATDLVGSPDPGCLYLPTLSDTTAQSYQPVLACPIY